MIKYYSIAIDGPAGAGKSTIAKEVAKKLNFLYIDTGAMYRAFALYCLRQEVNINSSEQFEELSKNIDIKIKHINQEQIIILNGENVTNKIRTPEIGNAASIISAYKSVRIKLVELQRNIAKSANIIMDGRDIGTYVLPNAHLKIFLTASVKERAKRRWIEYKQNNKIIDLKLIEEEISKRDYNDMNRSFAPLKKADDAIEINSTELTITQVIDIIIKFFNEIRGDIT